MHSPISHSRASHPDRLLFQTNGKEYGSDALPNRWRQRHGELVRKAAP